MYFNSKFHYFMHDNGLYWILAAAVWIFGSWLIYS